MRRALARPAVIGDQDNGAGAHPHQIDELADLSRSAERVEKDRAGCRAYDRDRAVGDEAG